MSRVILGFLQNAWSPLYAGGEWPRRSWLKALRASRSGQRLTHLSSDSYDIEFHNCTPICGETPDSVVKPDLCHVTHVIETCGAERGQLTILTFGKIAERAVFDAFETFPLGLHPFNDFRMIAMPHPAHRVVTNALFREARTLLLLPHLMDARRVRLRQLRGGVAKEEIQLCLKTAKP